MIRGASDAGRGVARDTRPTATPRGVLRRILIGAVILLGFGLSALVTGASIGLSTGLLAGLVGLLFAVIPLGVVVPAFAWVDRFESEPRINLVFAFAWGSVVATALALILNTGSMLVLENLGRTDSLPMTAVVVAPVVEELAKGFGVFLLLRFQRREFDGVVDGLVYAGMTAAGFAFAENILYLGRAFAESGPVALAGTFVMRGLVSPFAHPLFTCCTGIGLGYAARTRSTAVRILAPLLGCACAVVLHAAWNLSSLVGIDGFLTLYLTLQLPIFCAFVGLAVWARRQEGRMITTELQGYAQAGWFTPGEVTMLGSMPARRRAQAWARATGGPRALSAMHRFQDCASELALLRLRVASGHGHADDPARERALLGDVMRARAGIFGPSTLDAPGPHSSAG